MQPTPDDHSNELTDAEAKEAYIHALEEVARRAREFWHVLYLDSCLITPEQVGAEARFQQAMEKVRWMRES